MRPALCNLLYERYPDLYRNFNQLGISCDDGWFSIVDALSETLTLLDPACRAREVNETFGVLNYRCIEHSSEVNEAIRAAVNYSHLVCELTGKRGDLIRIKDGVYKSISLDGSFWIGSTKEILKDRQSLSNPGSYVHGYADARLALAPKRQVWSKGKVKNVLKEFNDYVLTEDCFIDVPASGFDLVHSVIRSLVPLRPVDGFLDRKYYLRIFRIIFGNEGISVDITPESIAAITRAGFNGCSTFDDPCQLENSLEYEICNLYSGLNAVRLFARNMEKRLDLKTGRIGPVDDQGQLIPLVDNCVDNAVGGEQ